MHLIKHLLSLSLLFSSILAAPFEIPATHPGDQIITHTAYTLSYSEPNEQASWVAYQLTAAETHKSFNRSDKFVPDPLVSTGSADDADYRASGYDRGHLAPAADMSWSATSMQESFYYSNMSPQAPSFNRGIWKNLEVQVRSWAIEYDSIYVVTGPVLTKGLPTIGPDHVSVPSLYYKVILRHSPTGYAGIAFLMPNAGSSASIAHFSVPIDSVEALTGIDFFPNLSASAETTAEGTLCLPCWSWSPHGAAQAYSAAPHPIPASSSASEEKLSVSVQCEGVTKAGKRCKHMTFSPNRLCFQHGGN